MTSENVQVARLGQLLESKINNRTAHVGIVGLGYVGLPLVISNWTAGYQVSGFDIDPIKVESLKRGKSYISDITNTQVAAVAHDRSVSFHCGLEHVSTCDFVIICVPTPLKHSTDPESSLEPDMSILRSAIAGISTYIRRGQVVIIESTSYPGTTRREVLPILTENSNLNVGIDFFVAFSPERINPGSDSYELKSIPKLVGGITNECTQLVTGYYRTIFDQVIKVSSPEVAELAKLVENSYRLVNIGFVNELAILCEDWGIDIWEVIEAADSKPFGFQKFYPGPGVGGHCIPVDPLYLSWFAKETGLTTSLIDRASEINRGMPSYLIRKINKLLDASATGGTKRVLIIGVTYKADVADCRESTAFHLIEKLSTSGFQVDYFDPLVTEIILDNGTRLVSEKFELIDYRTYDLVIIHTDHSSINYLTISERANAIFDTRNILRRRGIVASHISTL